MEVALTVLVVVASGICDEMQVQNCEIGPAARLARAEGIRTGVPAATARFLKVVTVRVVSVLVDLPTL